VPEPDSSDRAPYSVDSQWLGPADQDPLFYLSGKLMHVQNQAGQAPPARQEQP